jgi:hypothetical protein
MTMSANYRDFIDKVDTYRPRYGEHYRLLFPYEKEQDDGQGL